MRHAGSPFVDSRMGGTIHAWSSLRNARRTLSRIAPFLALLITGILIGNRWLHHESPGRAMTGDSSRDSPAIAFPFVRQASFPAR